jgi:hypothetical protein
MRKALTPTERAVTRKVARVARMQRAFERQPLDVLLPAIAGALLVVEIVSTWRMRLGDAAMLAWGLWSSIYFATIGACDVWYRRHARELLEDYDQDPMGP